MSTNGFRLFYLSLFLLVHFFLFGQDGQRDIHYLNNSLVDANSTPVIFNRDNLLSNQLLTYSLQFNDNGNLQKLTFLPFKLKQPKRYSFLKETRINLAQQGDLTTLGFGIGFDNASPFGKRGTRIIEANPNNGSEDSSANLGSELFKNSLQLVLGANITLFPNWGSPSRDANKDTLVDNFYSVANINYMLGLIYNLSTKMSWHVSGYYDKGRESAVEGSKEVTFIGYALGFSKRLSILNRGHEGKKFRPHNKDFNRSVNIGLTFEHRLPIENAKYLSNGNTYTLAYSPYLDFKVTPFTQLRLSLPIKAIEGRQDERGFGPFFQFYIQL